MAQCWEDVVSALSAKGVAAFIAVGMGHRTTHASVKERILRRRSGIMQIILALREEHLTIGILGCQVMRSTRAPASGSVVTRKKQVGTLPQHPFSAAAPAR